MWRSFKTFIFPILFFWTLSTPLATSLRPALAVAESRKLRTNFIPNIKHFYHRIPPLAPSSTYLSKKPLRIVSNRQHQRHRNFRRPKPIYGPPPPPPTETIAVKHYFHYCGPIEHILPNYQHKDIEDLVLPPAPPPLIEHGIEPPKFDGGNYVSDNYNNKDNEYGLEPPKSSEEFSSNTNFYPSSDEFESNTEEHFTDENFNSYGVVTDLQPPQEGHDFVEVPQFTAPLDYNPHKATYDTPNAVNSYGAPVRANAHVYGQDYSLLEPPPPQLNAPPPQLDLPPPPAHQPTNIQDYFDVQFDDNYYYEQSDDFNRFQRDNAGLSQRKINSKRYLNVSNGTRIVEEQQSQVDKDGSESEGDSNKSKELEVNRFDVNSSTIRTTTTKRYPNHKYD